MPVVKSMIFLICICLFISWGYLKVIPETIKQPVIQQLNQWLGTYDAKPEKTIKKEQKINFDHSSFQTTERNQMNKAPVILGKITCLRHESLPDLIQLFYGTYSSWYLRYVKMVNPHLKDPRSIERGQAVHFPGVPVTTSAAKQSPDSQLLWIEMSSFKDIHAAYTYYINYPHDAPEITIIPYWNQNEGLTFSVLYAIPFQNRSAANQFINQFPQFLSQNCRIRNNWGNQATFFSKRVLDILY
jgi:hypothetical protein